MMSTEVTREQWGEGPWQDEPDKEEWIDPRSGLPCVALRHQSMGHFCGYVGVPEGHPCFGKEYDDVYEYVSDCHGGVTFSGEGWLANDESLGLCSDLVLGAQWWFGFDCNHMNDFAPGLDALLASLAKLGA